MEKIYRTQNGNISVSLEKYCTVYWMKNSNVMSVKEEFNMVKKTFRNSLSCLVYNVKKIPEFKIV